MNGRFLAVACVMAAVAVTGCSSSSKPSSSSAPTSTTNTTNTTVATGKEPVCSARANLKQSVTALANPALLIGGKAQIQSALDTAKTNLDAVASSAGAVYQPQVDAMKSAVDDLETAVSKLGNGNATQNLQAVGTAIAKVGSTSATLISTLQTACPSS